VNQNFRVIFAFGYAVLRILQRWAKGSLRSPSAQRVAAAPMSGEAALRSPFTQHRLDEIPKKFFGYAENSFGISSSRRTLAASVKRNLRRQKPHKMDI
jgi:hypothetical protein